MNRTLKAAALMLAAACFSVLTGCTSMITEEQLPKCDGYGPKTAHSTSKFA